MVEASLDNLPPAAAGLPPKPRNRRILHSTIVIIAVLALLGAGWAAATVFQSPAQRALNTDAPPRGNITAEVTRGALQDVVNAVGSIDRRDQQTVPTPIGSGASVVTKQQLPVGTRIVSMGVVLEANGRPLLATIGNFPFYRDLSPGLKGPDVGQLQSGLKAAGYNVSVDSVFGASTEAAIRAVYKKAGYDVPVTPTIVPDTSPSAATLEQRASLLVPVSAFLVFRTLPATLLTSPLVGSTLQATSTITAESGIAVVSAVVTPAVALRLKNGMTAAFTSADGKSIPLTISEISTAASPTTSDPANSAVAGTGAAADPGGSSTIYFAVTSDTQLPDSMLHSKPVIAITVNVAAHDSLLVPTIAVVSGGGGQAYLLKENANGSFVKIPVTETAQLAGRSAVTPTKSGDLHSGDQITVG